MSETNEKKSLLGNNKKDFPISIGFWESSSNNSALSHKDGLTQEQVDFFQSLKVGDRLVIWDNSGKASNAPHLNLKKLEAKKL